MIALDNLCPFGEMIGQGPSLMYRVLARRKEIHPLETPIGELAPGEVAEPIRPVVKAFFEDLLMEPGTVEAECLRRLDVSA